MEFLASVSECVENVKTVRTQEGCDLTVKNDKLNEQAAPNERDGLATARMR